MQTVPALADSQAQVRTVHKTLRIASPVEDMTHLEDEEAQVETLEPKVYSIVVSKYTVIQKQLHRLVSILFFVSLTSPSIIGVLRTAQWSCKSM